MKKRICFVFLMAVLLLAATALAVSATEEGVYCPHCDTVVTDWTEWTATASGSHSQTTGGHFYLSKDFTGMGGRYGIASGSETVVLDLRGHTIESTNNRAFFVSSGTLTILDSVGGGTMIGARDGDGNLYVAAGAKINMYGGTAKTSKTTVSSSGGCGSVLYVLNGGEFNLYGGTLDGSAITTRNAMSGTACVKGTLNVYGGTITGGNATNGGNVYLDGGTLYMTGGTITGGQAVNGGNIYTKNAATVTIGCDAAKGTVATVEKGHATTTGGLGGNLCVNGGSTVNLAGGKIVNGISDARGGNISNGGANTYNITAGEMTGGMAATDGHNMFSNNGSVILNISGGYIDGGMDIRLTPNINLSGNPVITGEAGGLVLSLGTTYAKVNPGTFTEGAKVCISAKGAFTDALENAESYLSYIQAGSMALSLSAEESKLTASVICPHCGQAVTWTPWEDAISTSHARTEGGHFYLTGNVSGTGRYKIASGEAVVLDLQGYNITSTTDRVFYVESGKLAIVDSVGTGVMKGSRNGDGIVRVDAAQLDMYGGTMMTTRTEIATGNNGSVLYVGNASGSFTLHDGTLYGGTITTATATSGTVYTKGLFRMVGGRVLNGYATTGGNIFVNATGTFQMEGGLVYGGEGTTAGGNVYASSGTVIVTGGTIAGGQGGSGGGVYLYSAVGDLQGGTICGNAGTYGGNVHTAGNATKGGLNLGNCNIYGGTATKSGADIYISSDGAANLATKEAAIKEAAGKTVVTNAGDMVLYVNGYYTVHDHDYKSAYTAPTLEADGFTTYTCEGCGGSYKTVDEGTCLRAVIRTQPADASVQTGEKAPFAVVATGEGLTYAWQYQRTGGTKWFYTTMEGCDTAALQVEATLSRNGYKYRCIVTDAYGNQVISETVTLTVAEKTITTSGPEDQVAAGGKAVFTVEVRGEGLTYTWQYQRAGGTKWFYTTMEGCNTESLTVTATASRNGYKYRCIVKDAYGNETVSQEAILTVE